MAKNSLASETADALPRDPHYDAIYAEIASTHHGRRFLAEYARRHDGTAPQSLIGTIARIESSFRDLPAEQAPASLIRSLVDLAEAIERLEAAVATRRAPDGLHETEALLHAALDAATREINAVIEGSNASTVRSLCGRALLREVRLRIGHMLTLLIAILAPDLASASEHADPPNPQIEEKSAGSGAPDLAKRDALAPLAALSQEELVALFS